VAIKFCPNCGTKLPIETAKFCPECGFRLDYASGTVTVTTEKPVTDQPKNEKAFELLKNEIFKNTDNLSRTIADELLEKWKPCRSCPQSVGRAVDVIAERVLPSAVQLAVSSVVWQDEQSIEMDGHWDTTVSTAFPIKLNTGIPFLGKVHIDEVKLTIKGNVDVNSNAVTELRIERIGLQ